MEFQIRWPVIGGKKPNNTAVNAIALLTLTSIAVGTKPRVLRLLKINGKGVRGSEWEAAKKAYTAHTTNIISQRQQFVVYCLNS
jgi:hypothetical protein